jgi:hypothetical protein
MLENIYGPGEQNSVSGDTCDFTFVIRRFFNFRSWLHNKADDYIRT